MFKVNGIVIKNPTTFRIERYNVTTMERLADASMVGDLVAKKLKFYFTYDAVTASDLNIILQAIWDSPTLFYPLEYPYNGNQLTASVYVGSIPSELHRANVDNDSWVWKGVTFNLIER
jgi:hypothetical protein